VGQKSSDIGKVKVRVKEIKVLCFLLFSNLWLQSEIC